MYEDPKGKECRCKSQRTARTKDFGWGEHHTYWGWQRHSMCKRAGVWWRRNYGRRLFLALGVNLLPRDKTPTIFQSPQGWGTESYKPGERSEGRRVGQECVGTGSTRWASVHQK